MAPSFAQHHTARTDGIVPDKKVNKMRRGLMVTAVLLASLSAACGGDDDGGGSSGGVDQKMVDMIVEQGETEEVATCFATELKDYSSDDLDELLNGSGEPDEEFAAALADAGEKCAED